MVTHMKITIEFDEDTTREYELTKNVESALLDGEHVNLEFCHPDHGEIAVIKIGNPL